VALSALILHEPVGAFRWGAAAVGFLGVLIVAWPRLTLLGQTGALSQTEVLGLLASLGAAATYAANVLVMGQLVRTDATTTVVLWLTTSGTLALGCALPFVWVPPSLGQMAQLALVGTIGGAVLLAISESLRAATAATSAPFEYASLIFAALLGFVLFGEEMDAHSLTGGALLIAAGLAILTRERRAARRHARALTSDA
jgi:drug/metabolite transporter (DMT)-like permease